MLSTVLQGPASLVLGVAVLYGIAEWIAVLRVRAPRPTATYVIESGAKNERVAQITMPLGWRPFELQDSSPEHIRLSFRCAGKIYPTVLFELQAETSPTVMAWDRLRAQAPSRVLDNQEKTWFHDQSRDCLWKLVHNPRVSRLEFRLHRGDCWGSFRLMFHGRMTSELKTTASRMLEEFRCSRSSARDSKTASTDSDRPVAKAEEKLTRNDEMVSRSVRITEWQSQTPLATDDSAAAEFVISSNARELRQRQMRWQWFLTAVAGLLGLLLLSIRLQARENLREQAKTACLMNALRSGDTLRDAIEQTEASSR